MILEFKTKRDINGNRKYLYIDTGAETFSLYNPHFITQGIEIKTADYNGLIEKLKMFGFREFNF
jgi:hypothetical protein